MKVDLPEPLPPVMMMSSPGRIVKSIGYTMLLQRLRDHRHMEDGILWSVHADFPARLADWEEEFDATWPLLRAERAALVELNVPYFFSPSDGQEIMDVTGITARTAAVPGLDRASDRIRQLDESEIAWQVEVIRQNTGMLTSSDSATFAAETNRQISEVVTPSKEIFLAEADRIAEELSHRAIRRDPGASWIGLDWLGDSEVSRLVALGPELYNGSTGIALFLAAHAAVTANKSSQELALAALSHVRKSFKSRNAARVARSLGIGAATGVGSIVYALTVISTLLRDQELLADAHAAAELFTDDLVAADTQLDVMGGSAGAILGLLRLHRENGSPDALKWAMRCGWHLLAQPRVGAEGRRSWKVPGSNSHPLNGMSHGAAGFAYALASLASATGQEEFASAAVECIAFENTTYDPERNNWPDLRAAPELSWPCQWCRGAPGIGLARTGTMQCGAIDPEILKTDICNALLGAEQGWPRPTDTLCCGTLGNIEFFWEAAGALDRDDLRERASRQLMAIIKTASLIGDYRWNTGKRDFNIGLFRGLAGIGYTTLRQVDRSLPNVLVWE